jgi:hypothetical protein
MGWILEPEFQIGNFRFEVSNLATFFRFTAQRVRGRQLPEQPLLKTYHLLLLSAFRSHPVVEMSLAFYVRVLECVGPGANLPGAGLRHGFQGGDFSS